MTTKTTRRAILAGAAALPALSLPVIAAIPTARPNPDAELVALGKELEAAVAEWRAYDEGPLTEAYNRYKKLRPPKPAEPPKMPAKLLRMLPQYPNEKRTYLTYGEYMILAKVAPKHPIMIWQKQQDKKSRESDAERRLRQKMDGQAGQDSGLETASKERERLYDDYRAIFDEIMQVRARTPEGLSVKMRAVKLTGNDDSDLEDNGHVAAAWKSLRADILSMASAVQS
jgi:hypothetical protein